MLNSVQKVYKGNEEVERTKEGVGNGGNVGKVYHCGEGQVKIKEKVLNLVNVSTNRPCSGTRSKDEGLLMERVQECFSCFDKIENSS